jgi:hypothetical protein
MHLKVDEGIVCKRRDVREDKIPHNQFLEAEADVERRHDNRVGVARESKANLIGRAKCSNQLTNLNELVVEAMDQLMRSQALWRRMAEARGEATDREGETDRGRRSMDPGDGSRDERARRRVLEALA